MIETNPPLKLVALDAEDLAVLSAHVQDAVLRIGDMAFLPRQRRFALAMNRFVWETAKEGRRRSFERRRAALHFDRVLSVKATRIRRDVPDAVLDMLAVVFEPGAEAPGGHVLITFAGGGAVRLEVECIEAQLADLGAAWQTRSKPTHDLSDRSPGT